jgi:uncharacterized glyoxalase superfamily protein PhnB
MPVDPTRPTVYPVLRYRDPAAAIRFLVDAFGFREPHVTPDPDGTITHAELTWEPNGGLMLSARREDGDPKPWDVAGPSLVYLVADDVDAHHDKAVAAGAEIVFGPTDMPYGSREYLARDPEGHLWSIGTYQPV